jgi:uncharacterized NAD(P)/FAD-binding protein YdhS
MEGHADCVVIVTAHTKFDCSALVKEARLIVDTRNALQGSNQKTLSCFRAADTAALVGSARISISSTATSPGASLLLPITFVSQSSSVSGIQFDLHFDPSALSLSAGAASGLVASLPY